MKRNIVGEKLTRSIDLGEIVNEDERTIEVSLSSEFPVSRWDGDEVLVHSDEAIDLSRFPLPLCVAHDTYRGLNIGLIENPSIEDKKLRATLRFGERQEANEYWTDVKNGIIRSLSVGYQVQATDDQDKHTYKVTRWQPYEASLVSVPADPTIGVGRSFDDALGELSEAIKSAEGKKKKKIIRQVETLLEKYKTRHDHDDADGEPDDPDPMIQKNLARQVSLKEKQIILEN